MERRNSKDESQSSPIIITSNSKGRLGNPKCDLANFFMPTIWWWCLVGHGRNWSLTLTFSKLMTQRGIHLVSCQYPKLIIYLTFNILVLISNPPLDKQLGPFGLNHTILVVFIIFPLVPKFIALPTPQLSLPF